jgi:hypothetical protein
LSKSDFKLARTCDAKLFFRENGYPDTRDSNPYLALLAEGGYMVEALAKAMHPDGIQLEYNGATADAYAKTIEHLRQDTVTLFEATLLHNRRQARIDILEKKGNAVRILEVKAKSFDGADHADSIARGMKGALRQMKKPFHIRAEWAEKIEDVAFQTILLEKLRPDLVVKPFLVLVDKSKVSGVDNVPGLFDLVITETSSRSLVALGMTSRVQTARFSGERELLAHLDLVTEVDVSEEVAMLRDVIEDAAERFESMLDAPLSAFLPRVERGSKCAECEFRVADEVQPNGFFDCWGPLAAPRPHVLELYRGGQAKLPDKTPLIEGMIARGSASLLDVPLECFEAKPEPGANGNRQRRQIEHTRAGTIYSSAELRQEIDKLAAHGPLHFIDFETSRLALPYHKGMRPYGLVAFQWSCHTSPTLGADPRHAEWLNQTDVWPNQSFVDSLRATIGDTGPVLTWSHFEATTLKQIDAELPQTAPEARERNRWLMEVVEHRIVDLHQWACRYYYHPGMRGRTSIKIVLDALWKSDPLMREQFASWTGRSAEHVRDPYHTLPKVEIAGVEQDVHEGTGAMRAYQEMMYGAEKNNPVVKEQWAGLLRQYCALDTLSMVLILEHWRRLA